MIQKHSEVMVPTYKPVEMVPKKAEGSRIWDVEGNEYIDFAGGIAVLALGHKHPAIMNALETQANKIWHISNYCTNLPALEAADKLIRATFAERVFFSNSGTEANEAALKMARKYAWKKYGSQKYEIVSFYKSFHGRSLFTVTAGGQPKYHEGFAPLPEGILYAEYNHLKDIEKKVSRKTCAVILEPIMAEGGVHDATTEFIQQVRMLCDRHNALMIMDEVQTGMGRTGSLFNYQKHQVIPDILTSAKALGCGFPVSAVLTTQEIAKVFSPGSHGTTLGGNPLACSIVSVVMDEINQPNRLKKVLEKRKYFDSILTELNRKYSLFEEFRGQGLLIGCVLADPWKGKANQFMDHSIQEGLFHLIAGPDVIRFTPSFLISEEEIQKGMKSFEKAFQNLQASS